MWPNRHQRLILATVLKNCRLGSSLNSILLKNNIPNSFKLLERPTPEDLCYRLPSHALISVRSQQHHWVCCCMLFHISLRLLLLVIFQGKRTIFDQCSPFPILILCKDPVQ